MRKRPKHRKWGSKTDLASLFWDKCKMDRRGLTVGWCVLKTTLHRVTCWKSGQKCRRLSEGQQLESLEPLIAQVNSATMRKYIYSQQQGEIVTLAAQTQYQVFHENYLISEASDGVVNDFCAAKFDFKFTKHALTDKLRRKCMMCSALVWYDPFKDFLHFCTMYFHFSLCEISRWLWVVSSIWCSLPLGGCILGKDKLDAEFQKCKVLPMLTYKKNMNWAEASHFEGLSSQDLVDHDHRFQIEQCMTLS